jgi:hypothetical protein
MAVLVVVVAVTVEVDLMKGLQEEMTSEVEGEEVEIWVVGLEARQMVGVV